MFTTSPRSHYVQLGLAMIRNGALIALCVLSVALTVKHIVVAADWINPPFDWTQISQATRRLDGTSLYDWESRAGFEYSYRYSPPFAYLMVPVVSIGITAWRALHLAVLLVLPWRVVLVTLIAWPFWEDVYSANVMTFAFVFGWLAMTGSRWGTGAYLALSLLVPRPLMLPLAIWLLWKRSEWRIPALVLVAGFVALTLASGEAGAFLNTLLRSDNMVAFQRNFGPSRYLGLGWLLIGIPLAAWLTLRGRVGWASLAVSPYLIPYHFLMGLLETASPDRLDPERRPEATFTTVTRMARRSIARIKPRTEPQRALG